MINFEEKKNCIYLAQIYNVKMNEKRCYTEGRMKYNNVTYGFVLYTISQWHLFTFIIWTVFHHSSFLWKKKLIDWEIDPICGTSCLFLLCNGVNRMSYPLNYDIKFITNQIPRTTFFFFLEVGETVVSEPDSSEESFMTAANTSSGVMP